MLSQSELKPDAEPFEPRLETNDEYVAHTFSSGDSEQIQDHNYHMHAVYQHTSYQMATDPTLQAYNSGVGLNYMLPLITVAYHPVTGELVYMPTIPTDTYYWPTLPMMNQPPINQYGYYTSAWSPQLHMNEDHKETQNLLPSDDTIASYSIGNPMYCDICGVPIDKQPKKNHYTSAEHQRNMKEHSTYQEIKNKYKNVFEDAKYIISSTRRSVHVARYSRTD